MDDLLNIGVPDVPSEFIISGDIKINIKARINISNELRNRIRRFQQELKYTPGELGVIIGNTLHEALSAKVWDVPSGLGDIIDSGELYRSQVIEWDERTIDISYDVPYAALVHYGGYIAPYGRRDLGMVYIPPRPWITEVLFNEFQGTNIRDVYEGLVRALVSRI